MILHDFIYKSVKDAKEASAKTGVAVTKMTLCAKAYTDASEIKIPSANDLNSIHKEHDWDALSTLTIELRPD